jgi:hypothetical protein
MVSLAVQIVRFVDEAFPGFVACEFTDASGRHHTLIDKVPIFSTELLDSSTKYPQDGVVRCEVLSRWRDHDNRELLRITIARPDGVESTDGMSEFVVFSSQVR